MLANVFVESVGAPPDGFQLIICVTVPPPDKSPVKVTNPPAALLFSAARSIDVMPNDPPPSLVNISTCRCPLQNSTAIQLLGALSRMCNFRPDTNCY